MRSEKKPVEEKEEDEKEEQERDEGTFVNMIRVTTTTHVWVRRYDHEVIAIMVTTYKTAMLMTMIAKCWDDRGGHHERDDCVEEEAEDCGGGEVRTSRARRTFKKALDVYGHVGLVTSVGGNPALGLCVRAPLGVGVALLPVSHISGLSMALPFIQDASAANFSPYYSSGMFPIVLHRCGLCQGGHHQSV